ncbi:MAG TPA: hypothetical protein VGB84_10400 [Arachidicoccus sp.]
MNNFAAINFNAKESMNTNYAFDSEIETGLPGFLSKYPPTTPRGKSDWKTFRENTEVLLKIYFTGTTDFTYLSHS